MRIDKYTDDIYNKYILESARGDTTLRGALEIIAEKLGVKGYVKGVRYCLHHYDGNHDNNELSNLILMPLKKHASYHRTLNVLGIPKESSKAVEILETKYKDDFIPIGKILDSMIYTKASKEAYKDDLTVNDNSQQ